MQRIDDDTLRKVKAAFQEFCEEVDYSGYARQTKHDYKYDAERFVRWLQGEHVLDR